MCPISRYYLGTLKVLLWFFVQLPLSNKIGECHGSFKSPPRIREYTYFYPLLPKKVKKSISKQLQFGFKVFLLPIALPQGQLTEVPIYFKIFTIKVVGQTILAWSTTKMSKLQSNGIIKLGLVKSVVLYCNLTPQELQKCKLKLVTDFQINFSGIDLN